MTRQLSYVELFWYSNNESNATSKCSDHYADAFIYFDLYFAIYNAIFLLIFLQTKWICEDLERIAIHKKQKIEKIHKEPGQSNGQLISTTVTNTKKPNQF